MRDAARDSDGAPVVRTPIDRNTASEGGRFATDIMQSQDSAPGEQGVVFLIVDVHVYATNDARFRHAGIPLHSRERTGPFRAVDFVEATARVGIRLRGHDGTTCDRQTGVLLESNHSDARPAR